MWIGRLKERVERRGGDDEISEGGDEGWGREVGERGTEALEVARGGASLDRTEDEDVRDAFRPSGFEDADDDTGKGPPLGEEDGSEGDEGRDDGLREVV